MTTIIDKNLETQVWRHGHNLKMNEILPRLFLSNKSASEDLPLRQLRGITHIITVMSTYTDEYNQIVTLSQPREYFDTRMNVKRLIIPVDDIPSTNLIHYFPHTTSFIQSALSQPRASVLVHCLAGASRSPTIVASYLIQQHHLSPAEALRKIKSVRPQVRPILAFLDQLEVFYKCGCEPTEQAIYLHWKIRFRCETEIRLPEYAKSSPPLFSGVKVLERGKVLAKIPIPIPYVSPTGSGGKLLRCTECQMPLAPCSLLLPPLNAGDYLLAQPMEWMRAEVDNREHKGELQCPGCDDQEKDVTLGCYDWNGVDDGNGEWITPAFILYRRAVAEMD